MDEFAAELERTEAADKEVEERLRKKMEERAAELREAKKQKKAVEEEDEDVEEDAPEPLDLSTVTANKVLPMGGPLRNGTEPDFDEARAEELMRFIALRWTSLEYEKDYPVYVEVRPTSEISKAAKGQARKKKTAPDPKIQFRLRKHKMAGAVQDPVVLTSRAVIGAGIPLLTLVLGTFEEVAKDLHATLMEGVDVMAILTDVPWGDEKDTGYNTTVDWGAALRGISTVFDLNAGLSEDSKKQDFGKADGEAIVFAMGDITAINSINHEAGKNRLKVCKIHHCLIVNKLGVRAGTYRNCLYRSTRTCRGSCCWMVYGSPRFVETHHRLQDICTRPLHVRSTSRSLITRRPCSQTSVRRTNQLRRCRH